MLEKHMQQFEKDLGLDMSFQGSKPGIYLIPLKEGIDVVVSSIPNGFTLFCEYAAVPKENVNNVYYQSLTSNLFGQGTKGAALGLNDRGNMLTISQTVDYNIEYKDFKDMIDDFITAIDYWKKQIETK